MVSIIHRPDRRFRSEHRPQGAGKFLELPGQFLQDDAILVAQAVLGPDIAGIGGDFDGEEYRQVLAPQIAIQGAPSQ